MTWITTPLVIQEATQLAIQLAGLAVLAATLAAVVALSYRWYTRESVPPGLALLVGLGGVAVYLNTTTALGQVIGSDVGVTESTEVALFHIVAFLVATAGALGGRRGGDHFGNEVLLGGTQKDVDEEVSRLVQTVGRVVVVELPDEIDDVVGYDPVADQTKATLAGKRFVFPRNLTVEQLRSRLVSRLKTDYAIGHVDLALESDGSIAHLAVGSRAAGIGPTLPPATNAVTVRADPAFAASSGDLVQVWETDPMRRVLTAELRGVAEDVVTLAIDASDTPKIDPTRQYRLVTLPVDDRPEREFASLLRAADETFSSVTVEAGSPLHGLPVGGLALTIVSVKPDAAEPIALPDREYILVPGDTIFAIAEPDRLRHLETAAEPLDPSLVEDIGTPSVDTEPTPAAGDPAQQPAGLSQEGPPATQEPDTAEQPPATQAPDTAEQPSATQSPSEEPPTDTGPVADQGANAPTASAEDGQPIEGKADTGTFEELKEELREESEPDAQPATDDTTQPAADDDAAQPTAGDTADAGDGTSGGGTGFDELKAEFESGEADWDEDDEDDEPVEEVAASGGDDAQADSGGSASFDDLKTEFESGEADWDEEGDSAGQADAGSMADSSQVGEDDVVPLEEADISFEDDEDEEEDDVVPLEEADISFEDDEQEEEDDDLSGLDFEEEEEDDDLSGLDFEQEEDEGLSFEEGDEDDEDEAEDDEDDDEDDDESGGGGTFAQLKEEFDSGEADWEDDISDSPGGDMRLDE